MKMVERVGKTDKQRKSNAREEVFQVWRIWTYCEKLQEKE